MGVSLSAGPIRNKEQFRILVDAVTDYAIYMLDPEGRITSWNPGAERIKGYRAEEVLHRSFDMFFLPEDLASGLPGRLLEQARMQGRIAAEGRRLRKGGRPFLADVVLSAIWNEDGTLAGYAKVTRDITERKHLEELRIRQQGYQEMERQFRALTDTAPMLMALLDASGSCSYVNRTWMDFTGRSLREELGHGWREGIHPEDRAETEKAHQEGIRARKPFRLDYRLRARDGSYRWVLHTAAPRKDAEGNLLGFTCNCADIQDRKDLEVELQRSRRQEIAAAYEGRERLRVILEGISDAILVEGADGNLVFANGQAARFLGQPSADDLYRMSRIEGGSFRSLLSFADAEGRPLPAGEGPGMAAFRGHETPSTILRCRGGQDGGERWILAKASPVRGEDGRVRLVVNILRDITEAREAEERYRQAQKMEAVGRLAGGIAHDFNNLLTAINGYSDLLLSRTEGAPSELREGLEEIREAGGRAASLTQQLLAFSRKQVLMPRVLDVNEVMARMESILGRVIGENIRLVTRPAAGQPCIRADASQVEQVILNLAVNARDAMSEGGVLTMTTERVHLDAAYVAAHRDASQGPHIRLTVTDTGMGMDPEIKARIFEPFFTTKEEGKGTGLGLATVFGIVKQSGGSLDVESVPGRGTSFMIHFPACQAAADAPCRQDAVPETAPRPAGGELVLLVEDDGAVRNFVRKVLNDHGYGCLEAETGEQALALAQARPGEVRLLLTDVVLHGMSGRLLADKVRRCIPDVRILYMSGYMDDAVARHGVPEPGMELIHKPFAVKDLLERLEALLLKRPALGK